LPALVSRLHHTYTTDAWSAARRSGGDPLARPVLVARKGRCADRCLRVRLVKECCVRGCRWGYFGTAAVARHGRLPTRARRLADPYPGRSRLNTEGCRGCSWSYFACTRGVRVRIPPVSITHGGSSSMAEHRTGLRRLLSRQPSPLARRHKRWNAPAVVLQPHVR